MKVGTNNMNSRIKKLTAQISDSEALIQSYKDMQNKARSDSEKFVYDGWIRIEEVHLHNLERELQEREKFLKKNKKNKKNT